MSSVESLPFKLIQESEAPLEKTILCPICGNSSWRQGKRKLKYGTSQKYLCKTCGAVFSLGNKRVYPAVVRRYAIELYKNGASLANAADKIEEVTSIKLSRQCIRSWLKQEGIPRRIQKKRTNIEKTEIKRIEPKILLQVTVRVLMEDLIISEWVEQNPIISTE
jgi:transposase-like protein